MNNLPSMRVFEAGIAPPGIDGGAIIWPPGEGVGPGCRILPIFQPSCAIDMQTPRECILGLLTCYYDNGGLLGPRLGLGKMAA